MTQTVAETVTFALAQGTTAEAFLSEIMKTKSFVQSCPGFIFRRLSCGEDGRWTDTVIWQDMETAQAAAKAFETQEFLPALMAVVAPDTVQMRHETVHWTMEANATATQAP